MEGVALADALDRLAPSFKHPIFLNRLEAVVRAGRIETAMATHVRREKELIPFYQKKRELFHENLDFDSLIYYTTIFSIFAEVAEW